MKHTKTRPERSAADTAILRSRRTMDYRDFILWCGKINRWLNEYVVGWNEKTRGCQCQCLSSQFSWGTGESIIHVDSERWSTVGNKKLDSVTYNVLGAYILWYSRVYPGMTWYSEPGEISHSRTASEGSWGWALLVPLPWGKRHVMYIMMRDIRLLIFECWCFQKVMGIIPLPQGTTRAWFRRKSKTVPRKQNPGMGGFPVRRIQKAMWI